MRDHHFVLIVVAAFFLLAGGITTLRYQSCMDAIGSRGFCIMNTLR